MIKTKRPMLKKPVLSSGAVLDFAEGKAAKLAAKAATGAATSRFPPSGDVRLTVNMRDDLHQWLKIEAVKRRTTVGEILEELVQQHMKG
jgi:hypothetical protein